MLRRIAALCIAQGGEPVFEIGAGTGALTRALLELGADVTALEVDADLLHILRSRGDLTAANIIEADALTFDYDAATGQRPWCAAGNLPYNVATALITRWLELRNAPQRIVAMLQRDVAERLTARPNTSQYGSLTLSVGYWMTVRRAFTLHPGAFYPQPKVDSTVLVLERRAQPAVAVRDPRFLLQVVRAAFAYRRKTLANSLFLRSVSSAPELRARFSPSTSIRRFVQNNSTWAPSAPSPIVWAPDAWSIGSILLVVLGVAFCFVGVPLMYVVAGALAGFIDVKHLSIEQELIAQTISYVPLGLFLLAVLPRISRTSLYTLGFRVPTARDVRIGLGGIIAMWLVVTLVGTAIASLSHKHETEQAIALLRGLHTPGQKAFFAFIAIALAPMLEEMTFRVFLFNAWTRYVPLTWAAVLSGAIFGIVHAQPMSDYAGQLLTVSVSLALGGIILAYVYARTRCYWANVITHAGFNAISVIAVLFFHAK